jgi:hypothetical protein
VRGGARLPRKKTKERKMKEQCIDGLVFWSKKNVKTAFQEAVIGIKAGEDLKALRIFYRRMKYFLKTSDETDISNLSSRECFITSNYEKPLLKKAIAEINGDM